MAKFTAVDGSTVEIACDGRRVQASGATAVAVFDGILGEREFISGGKHLGEHIAARDGVALTEEYTARGGGKIRIGRQTATDPVTKVVATNIFGVWEGLAWSVQTWLPGGDSQGMLTIFDQFEFSETPTGVVMNSRNPQALALKRESGRAPYVNCYVDGLGLAEAMERTSAQEWQVPRTPGAPAGRGEMWVEESGAPDGGSSAFFFLVATDTALARVSPELSEVSEEAAIRRCSRLAIAWDRPLAWDRSLVG